MQDLSLSRGECLILGMSEKAKAIEVKFEGMLRGMLS